METLYLLTIWSHTIITLILLYIASKVTKSRAVITFAIIPVVFETLFIILSSLGAGYFSIVNLFGVIILLVLLGDVVIMLLYMMKYIEKHMFGGLHMLFSIILSLTMVPGIFSMGIEVIPVLKTPFLIVHVFLAVLGEALFFVGVFLSILTLIKNKNIENISKAAFMVNAAGFCVFATGALIMGMLWAKASWGRYWNWDPKEIWSLVTFLTYSGYLIVGRFMESNIKIRAWINIAAFIGMLFTIFGVAFVFGGLHSYK